MAKKHPRFQRVSYDALKARQKEIYNFQKIAATLAYYGFNCIKLADDWQGADFLAYHIDGKTTLKVQLKARPTIDRKYCNKDIWIAFPYNDCWYLVEHDLLVKKARRHTKWLTRGYWTEKGLVHSRRINPALLHSLDEHRLGTLDLKSPGD